MFVYFFIYITDEYMLYFDCLVCVFGAFLVNLMCVQLMGLFSRAQTFVSPQQLESIHWISENKFISSHNDGSYTYWSPGSDIVSEPITIYGPFPCKAISKIMVHSTTELVSSTSLSLDTLNFYSSILMV